MTALEEVAENLGQSCKTMSYQSLCFQAQRKLGWKSKLELGGIGGMMIDAELNTHEPL